MLLKIDIPPEYFPKVYVYRRGDSWWWKYMLPNGKYNYCSAGDNQKRAEANARLKQKDLLQGLFNEEEIAKMQDSLSGPISLPGAVNRYLSLTAPMKTGETKNGENAIIRAGFLFFEEKFKIKFLQKVTDRHIMEYRDFLLQRVSRHELSTVSANNRLKVIKKVFRFFRKRKEILFNPAEEIEPIEVSGREKARSVVLSMDQIQMIVKAPYQSNSGFDVKSFVLLMYATGMRPGEVRHLEWRDIDWDKRIIRLRCKGDCPAKYQMGWRPKWNKDRDIPLNDMAYMVLKRQIHRPSVGYIKGDPKPYPADFIFVTKDDKRSEPGRTEWKRIDDLRYSWRKLLSASGIWSPSHERLLSGDCPFHRHDVRRSWSAHAKESGYFSVDEASKILGHDPTVNIQHYGSSIHNDQIQKKMQQHPSNQLTAFLESC